MSVEVNVTIAGRNLTLHYSKFQEDPSVGLGLGPEEWWAEDEDGNPVELPEEVFLAHMEAACTAYRDACSNDYLDGLGRDSSFGAAS